MDTLLHKLLICALVGGSLAYLVFIWFRTTFALEYARLLRLDKWLKKDEWEDYFFNKASEGKEALYPVFLREKYPSWATKMLGCPFCLIGFSSVWVSIPIAWWASGPVAFLTGFFFLVLGSLYKIAYP